MSRTFVLIFVSALACAPRAAAAQAVSFSALPFPAAGGGQEVVAADFTRDGRPDLAVAKFGTIDVFPSNGDGTFSAPRSTEYCCSAVSLAAGDVNNDRTADLVYVQAFRGPEVRLGNGNGTFQDARALPGSGEDFVAIAELNGDRRMDLVVTETFTGRISVYLGEGNGSFQEPVVVPAGRAPSSVAAADFNGDGRMDLVSSNFDTPFVTLLIGHGDGTFAAPVNFDSGGFTTYGIVTADFNRDGHQDAAVAHIGLNEGVAVLLGNGDGSFQAPRQTLFSGGLEIAASDFNMDGVLDVAVSALAAVAVARGRGDGTFEFPTYVAAVGAADLVVSYFDANLLPDIAVSGWWADNAATLLLNTSQVPPSSCVLDLTLQYNGDNLAINYFVGTTQRARFNALLVFLDRTGFMWSVVLPGPTAPYSSVANLSGFPSIGYVGVLSTVTMPGQGPVCSAWKVVSTGGVGLTHDEATAALERSRELSRR